MAKVRGSDVLLLLTDDGFVAACARSITFDISNELIETSITGSGKFRTFKPGAIEWSGTIEGLTLLVNGVTDDVTVEILYGYLLSGSEFACRWYEQDITATHYMNKTGYIILESINETSSFDNMVTFTANFKGTGPITITTGDI